MWASTPAMTMSEAHTGRWNTFETSISKVHEVVGWPAPVASLRGPDDLDDLLRAWLTEAYLNSPT